jgi:hypothetical protein
MVAGGANAGRVIRVNKDMQWISAEHYSAVFKWHPDSVWMWLVLYAYVKIDTFFYERSP